MGILGRVRFKTCFVFSKMKILAGNFFGVSGIEKQSREDLDTAQELPR